MSDRKQYLAWCPAVLVVLLYPATAHSLNLGFEGLLTLESSDNVDGVNSPDEEDGLTTGVVLGVYGEQRSRMVDAAFTGEIDTRRIVTDDDTSVDTITRFLGAAEFALTPRSWRWYVGDILGGVRADNAIQTIDDTTIDRRNVFVTGPSFEYDVEGWSRTRARLLYVNQTEDSDVLETLYTANASYERDTTPGSYLGIRAGNVFTEASDETDNINLSAQEDFNRSTVAVYTSRSRGFLELYGELGVTRYDADEESLNGLNAQLRAVRQLGPKTSFSASLTRDLNDQTLSTVESLIASGSDGVGVQPEAAGFFEETRLDVGYAYQSTNTSLDLGVGVSQKDYQFIDVDSQLGLSADSEDQLQSFAYAALSRRLSSRLTSEFSINYERQTYDNRVDETDSILASAQLIYSLTTSFELEAGLIHDSADGVLTRFNTGVGVEEDVDITENRVVIGLRWAPPSRASQDLTVELKSLLQ
ncbi:hypothetical protein [Granulosicoccus antarcticus]|uniref:TIGR03016 family PEP-CTERM system-associated outer membrane protein n=1 Tax=Granulosicoccus antarcticus IMCC3135 TaxID=1192854 RepID=A0A2Z2NX03_9GAMM|nr:hypothetical protein [Granulosicoccus antarcticus]ASJ74975.1 hypothetical protein IMCC3135_24540 [Granulosicoccus antarcticus IMCC3135]